LAFAEYCDLCAARALELEVAAADPDHVAGLRRGRYPFRSWLDDHSHAPIAEMKAELDYQKAHVWLGHRDLIDGY
jgi:hypothetical protein